MFVVLTEEEFRELSSYKNKLNQTKEMIKKQIFELDNAPTSQMNSVHRQAVEIKLEIFQKLLVILSNENLSNENEYD